MIDIIIIGAGTAGMTAALYALRNGKSVLILERSGIGGQIANSPRVENFPSIKSISGSEFSENLFNQITDLGVQFEFENVVKIDKFNNYFNVITESNEFMCKSVIIAVGVNHRCINLPREQELTGKGISYCAVCDGPFYQGETVALVGNGNTAMQYAILLSNYCKKVYLCNLFDYFCGDNALEKTLKNKDNVEIINNVCLKEFVGENELQSLVFENTNSNEKLNLAVKGAFIAIGQVPNNKQFGNLVDLDNEGYIIADESCRTKTEGLFVAGDCRTKKTHQLTTAVADGAVASLNACEYIENSRDNQ